MSLEDYYTETIKVVTVTRQGEHSTASQTESCSTASAAVNPVSGNEAFSAGQNYPFADYKAFVSSTVTITESNKVIWDSTRYNVLFVKNTLNRDHHKLAYLSRNNYQ